MEALCNGACLLAIAFGVSAAKTVAAVCDRRSSAVACLLAKNSEPSLSGVTRRGERRERCVFSDAWRFCQEQNF